MAARQQGNCSTLDSMRRESISLSLARNQGSALDCITYVGLAQDQSFRGCGGTLRVAGRGTKARAECLTRVLVGCPHDLGRLA